MQKTYQRVLDEGYGADSALCGGKHTQSHI